MHPTESENRRLLPSPPPRGPVRTAEGDRGASHRGGHRPPTDAAARARGATPRVLGRTGPAPHADHPRAPVPHAPAAPVSPSRAGGITRSVPPARPASSGRRTGVPARAPDGLPGRPEREEGGGSSPPEEPACSR